MQQVVTEGQFSYAVKITNVTTMESFLMNNTTVQEHLAVVSTGCKCYE